MKAILPFIAFLIAMIILLAQPPRIGVDWEHHKFMPRDK